MSPLTSAWFEDRSLKLRGARPCKGRAPWLLGALVALGCLATTSGRAAIVEEVVRAPVTVQTIYGPYRQDIIVTVFRDDERQSAPYLVLNHGRTAPRLRAAMGRARSPKIASSFVSLGFTVLEPTRIGYGATGGPDVEFNGPCWDKDFAPGIDAAADQVAAVLRRARTLPSVDLSSGIVVGHSFGGITAVNLGARNLPGLVATVNFAGGAGGDLKMRPEHPCGADRVNAIYRSYGAAAKVPSLWLYSPNDRFWGPWLPQQWFRTFIGAGARARFVQLPPFGDNGHKIFLGDPNAWIPAFEQFLQHIGFMQTAPQAMR